MSEASYKEKKISGGIMKPAKPIYKNLLLIVLIIWIIGITYYVSDLYFKIGEIEHALVHTKQH